MSKVGTSVQFFVQRTLNRGQRLETPQPIGPLPALVLKDSGEGIFDLFVFLPTGRTYIAQNVTDEPTTPVQHYWQPIQEECNHARNK